ncbi:hypothetical protein GCM10008015_04910 [Flavobacterium palustre]|uniref:Insecticide toxin TcdB middle/N-terminal domain-containing protein n=1 Tax=Flavobacterium palustre TaxID=1476463 RepID=A0ABQ1HAX4_9FLAO|nr:RHS repeat-associated core domain-containing protein [Flavobacterium palustre]GGA67192.1 hypothetical protein GCM10008015_04910 [Flavobacterium palustre]
MKQFYYLLIIFGYSLFISAQTTGPTGNSTEVGLTKGELSVSLSGAAIYDIPINVPPGINKVEPKVGLSYNSQGNNGIAGYGWNISGLSTITRIASTKFHDGKVDEINFDDLDRFSLDGQRLMIKNGTNGLYGADNTEYETENFSNTRITSYGVHPYGANYGPAYFKVEYQDGSKAYYGSSTDSRSISAWAITYWENAQGVRVNYNYNNSNNNLSINSINFGSIGGVEGINKIQFTYKTRERLEEIYVGGQSIINNTILSGIAVIGNGEGYRNYALEYDKTSLNYERLISITEKNGDNSKSYNPTVFEYENINDEVLISPNITKITRDCPTISNDLHNSAITGDFDNDGKIDVITYDPNLFYKEIPATYKPTVQLFQNLDSQSSSINQGNCFDVDGVVKSIFAVNYLKGDVQNNSNIHLSGGWCSISTDPITKATKFNVSSGNKDNTVNLESSFEYIFPKSSYTGTAFRKFDVMYYPGDFNGDGITDIIALETGSRTWNLNDRSSCDLDIVGQTFFVNLDKRSLNNVNFSGYLEKYEYQELNTGLSSDSFSVVQKVLTGDFNGDGKTDLIVFRNHYYDNGISSYYPFLGIDVYSLNESNMLTKICTTDFLGLSTMCTDLIAGDFNGDGKVDIMNDDNRIFTSTGNSFVINNIGSYYHPSFTKFFFDFNGDGKTDILYYSVDSNNGDINLKYNNNKNNGDFKNSEITSFMITRSFLDSKSMYGTLIPTVLTSEDEDKGPELCLIGRDGILRIKHTNNSNNDKLLKKVTIGNGVKESITYLSMDPTSKYNNNSIYTASHNIENYPDLDILSLPNNKVVVKIEQQSSTSYKKQLYSYYGGVSNLEGLGFLGFRATMRTNWHDDNTQIISYIAKNDINLRGANIENYSVLGLSSPENTPTNFINKSILTYDSQLLPNKVFKLKNTTTQQFNSLENTSSETTTSYDNYNNPTTNTTYLKNGGVTEQTTITNIDYDNQPTGATYYIGRPTKKVTTITVSGDTMSNEELYTYTNHLLTKIEKKGHNTNFITEKNDYDSFGNITKKTISGSDFSPRVTDYEYDTSGRFLTKSIDVERLSTTYSYNTANGLLNSETNPYGLTTTYIYDSWFKKIKTTDYLGKNATYQYFQLAQETQISISCDDGSYSQERYDDLGRKIKASVRDVTDTPSVISYTYDIYDRNIKVSEPYYGGFPTQWNEVKFDEYGRPIQNILFTGKTINISYSGLTTTIDEGTKTKLITKNSLGNVVIMTDSPRGTIYYTYFANGNLKTTDYDGVVTTIEQDGWGRKTKLIDPSAGTYTYTYNSLGETTSETTPNGTTTYTLDPAVGKLIKKTIVGSKTNSETTYNYDTTTKLLTSTLFKDIFEGDMITNNSFEYDSYNRLYKSTETTPYATFLKQFTFDDYGNVRFETITGTANGKTSSKTIMHTYQNGQHLKIQDNGRFGPILWQINNLNRRGQILSAQLGNSISITNTYDSYGFATKFKYDKGSDNVMTLNNTFDSQKSNLISRNNNLFNYSETFDYDNLDRLTDFITDNTFLYNTFDTTSVEGYEVEGGATITSSGGLLNVKASTAGATVKKTLLADASTGEKIELSFSFQRVLGNSTLNVYIQEQNRTTGAITKYFKTLASPGIININHTSTQDAILTLRIENVNATRINDFTINNVIAKRIFNNNPQEYDDRGRITQNAIGTYNYTNASKVYQNTSVDINPDAKNYYTINHEQNITYNTFKSPYQIEEVGKDKINFTYNDNNSRSAMFYGSLDTDKLSRPLRKYYSADGSMEIKHNMLTGAMEFITYIDGDAYTASVVLKSDGTTQNYLYLHRDYQGSILAISNEAGAIVEKRHFDAWGSIVRVQDGAGNTLNDLTILDRGYTGHEHLQSVNLIHMNGRLYDPKLHRFLQPDNNIQDPLNTQNFNRYGYVLNNPLKYTDPSGEFWQFVVGAIFTGYVSGVQASNGELNPTKWNSTTWTNAALGGASFGLSTVATNYANEYIVNYNKPPEIAGNSINIGDIKSNNTHSYISNNNSGSTSQTSGGQYYGGDGSGSFLDYFSRFVYETDQFNPIALAWDGIKGHITGSDRYGNALSGFESSMKIVSAVPMTKAASIVTNASEAAIFNGGKTFAQYKIARGGTETLAHIQTSTGVQRISTEFHHMFITQRMQRAYNLPNWMVNNRINVFKLNTIQHSLVDPYRYNFLRAGIKPQVGWFGQYNWFTKF